MNDTQSLRHTVWDCKYHVVWIPKYRRKVLYGQLRKELGTVIKELSKQKESEGGRGEVDGRSCAHVDLDSPKIFGSAGDRVYQRQERDLCGEIVREAEGTSWGRVFGPGGIVYRRRDWTRQ